MSRFKSNLYTVERRVWRNHKLCWIQNDDFTLFSGHHKTKIKEEDLPEWYVFGRYYKLWGFLSTKGITDLRYIPNLWINHFLKDDCLLISYGGKIEEHPDSTDFEKYSGVHQYMTDIVERAKADGFVSTLMGRRRWLPELKSSNFNLRSFGERVALNMPIQGTAADIIKLAMVRVHRRLAAEGLEARLIMQVHDELIVECPEAEASRVEQLLQQEMQGVAELSVPLLAEAHTGHNWLAAKG